MIKTYFGKLRNLNSESSKQVKFEKKEAQKFIIFDFEIVHESLSCVDLIKILSLSQPLI